MRIGRPRALDEFAPTAALGACIAQGHRMDRVAGHALGSRDHHAGHSGHGGTVAAALKARTRASGPAIAVSAVEMRFGALPLRVGRAGLMQAAELWCDRLLVLLTAR